MADLNFRGRALEEQWFSEKEKELIAVARRRREERLAAQRSEEREKLRQLHFMRCPKCGDQLDEVSFSGVLVDKCRNCEGVFFDASEVEALTKKSLEDRRGILRGLLGF